MAQKKQAEINDEGAELITQVRDMKVMRGGKEQSRGSGEKMKSS